MQEKHIIGGSSGDFYRISNARNTDKNILEYFIPQQSSALEVMLHDQENLHCEISADLLKEHFSHCSIHAPVYTYQQDETSHKICKYMEHLRKTLPIKNIVVHPDKVIDRSIFEVYKHLPFSIENMDERKKSCQGVDDLGKILEKNQYLGLTIDVQHVFVNDPTMQLGKDLHTAFNDKIVQYHVSGFHPEYLHYTLFKTHQKEIIQAVQKTHLPLIIESTFDNKDELDKEITYILSHLSS